jgi:hypothetical protein
MPAEPAEVWFFTTNLMPSTGPARHREAHRTRPEKSDQTPADLRCARSASGAMSPSDASPGSGSSAASPRGMPNAPSTLPPHSPSRPSSSGSEERAGQSLVDSPVAVAVPSTVAALAVGALPGAPSVGRLPAGWLWTERDFRFRPRLIITALRRRRRSKHDRGSS